jgi:hypothetical protein
MQEERQTTVSFLRQPTQQDFQQEHTMAGKELTL